jgi:hypothetical protein
MIISLPSYLQSLIVDHSNIEFAPVQFLSVLSLARFGDNRNLGFYSTFSILSHLESWLSDEGSEAARHEHKMFSE